MCRPGSRHLEHISLSPCRPCRYYASFKSSRGFAHHLFLPTRQIQCGNAIRGFRVQSYILSTSSRLTWVPPMISSVFSQKGRSFEDGENVDGIENGQMSRKVQWKCQYEDALSQPPRGVIDIHMGECASGGR